MGNVPPSVKAELWRVKLGVGVPVKRSMVLTGGAGEGEATPANAEADGAGETAGGGDGTAPGETGFGAADGETAVAGATGGLVGVPGAPGVQATTTNGTASKASESIRIQNKCASRKSPRRAIQFGELIGERDAARS